MAYATQTQRATGGSAWLWLGDLRSTFADRTAKYRLYRRTLGELANLTDRDLADLGIHRADIRDIAADAAYGA